MLQMLHENFAQSAAYEKLERRRFALEKSMIWTSFWANTPSSVVLFLFLALIVIRAETDAELVHQFFIVEDVATCRLGEF